ncbi:MAG TPA: hypothetical protein VKY92_00770 [Verrucomicrobiae bacterium]|nr:hypothetical protein [Verrucomicrobiae bacterium]
MKPKKSWQQKLTDNHGLPKIAKATGGMTRWGEGTMVVPAPMEVDCLMKQVPKGKLVTINELRAALAARHRVSFACPLTTGIFSWIAAHAADEAEKKGARRITPYWRTLKSGGELNAKYPGGLAAVARRIRREGHRVLHKGKRMFVADYQSALFQRLI